MHVAEKIMLPTKIVNFSLFQKSHLISHHLIMRKKQNLNVNDKNFVKVV